jgi:hypothetical protein
MADTDGSRLNIGAPVEKRGRGRPRGSKNKSTGPAAVASSSAPAKRRPGRPAGSKNKPKVLSAALIRLKRIYDFLCSMLVFTPFAYCFVTLSGTFMHFPELTY